VDVQKGPVCREKHHLGKKVSAYVKPGWREMFPGGAGLLEKGLIRRKNILRHTMAFAETKGPRRPFHGKKAFHLKLLASLEKEVPIKDL